MIPATRYALVANPTSGALPMNRRYERLKGAAAILRAKIEGLDTRNPEEFADCIRQQAERCDVLVVAGGDGTFSLAMNTVDLQATALAFLPFGTGNALTHALNYRGTTPAIANQIRNGTTHRCDLIDCGGRRKSFMASLGIDGTAIGLYETYRNKGHHGPEAHLRAGVRAYFKAYHPTGGWIRVGHRIRRMENLLSFMVVKQPFFGMGLKVVPRARWNDARLHTLALASGIPRVVTALLSGFTIGNRIGDYRAGKTATIRLDRPLALQIDGEPAWTSDRFVFTVRVGALRLQY